MKMTEALLSTAATLQLADRQILIRAEKENGISNAEAIKIGIGFFHNLNSKGLLEPTRSLQGPWVATDDGRAVAQSFCPQCFGPMGTGEALVEQSPGHVFAVNCRKCHACGFSEDAGPINDAIELPQPARIFTRGEVCA